VENSTARPTGSAPTPRRVMVPRSEARSLPLAWAAGCRLAKGSVSPSRQGWRSVPESRRGRLWFRRGRRRAGFGFGVGAGGAGVDAGGGVAGGVGWGVGVAASAGYA